VAVAVAMDAANPRRIVVVQINDVLADASINSIRDDALANRRTKGARDARSASPPPRRIVTRST
jgi:hypothetical protein